MMTDTAGAPIDPRYLWIGLEVREDRIPASIKAIDQWVLWRAETRQAPRIGVDKVPYQASGAKAKPGDPATWTDFASVLAAYQEEGSIYSGVGFNVKADNGILVLDWDHVRNAINGDIDSEILAQVKWLGSYAEISPSGTGIRVVGFGTLSNAITSPTFQGWAAGRYVTITGEHIPGTPTELQPIDPMRLAALIEHFCPQKPEPSSASAAPGPMLDTPRVLELRHALGHIPPDDYQVWVTIGMALQSTRAGNAFGLWNEWSTGSAKYPGIGECRKKWASFNDRPGGIEIETVYTLAAQHGWVNPATRAAQAFEREVGVSLEEANRLLPAPVVFVPEPERAMPFPVAGLDEVCRWIEAGAGVSYPVVTQHAAICLAATAASRRYVTPMGDPLSLYMGASGQSIGDLRYTHDALYAALAEAGLRRMVRDMRFTSAAAIYKTLMRSPATLYLSDDYGGMNAFAKRQPSGAQDAALGVLAKVYSGKSLQLDNMDEAGLKQGAATDDQPVIQCPALSMLALVGDDHLVTLMRASEFGRGALGQLFLVIADEDQVQQRDPEIAPPPAWLAAHLCALRAIPLQGPVQQVDLASINNGNAENLPIQVAVTFQADLAAAYAGLDAVSRDRRVQPLLRAARAHVRRVCAVLAAWRDPVSPVVDGPIMEWTSEYVRARMAALVERFQLLHGSDGKPGVYDQVLLKVIEAKADGIQPGHLPAVCKAFRDLSSERRGELVQQLLADETVFEVTTKTGGRGRPSKRLVAAKYLKKGGGE